MKHSQVFEIYSKLTKQVGQVTQIKKQIAFVSGLPHARIMDLVVFGDGQRGFVVELTQDSAEVVLLDYPIPQVGTAVTRTHQPVGVDFTIKRDYSMTDMFLGLDLATHPTEIQLTPIDSNPPELESRSRITKPLPTDISAIDVLVPLGQGQRQLLIGDRSTGKTTTAIQMAQALALQGFKTIICLIGKRTNEIMQIRQSLQKHPKAQENISLVVSAAHEPVGKIILTPYSAMTLAEYYVKNGHDTVVVFDDLTSQASFYRELSLIRGGFPGKESYPGDIFHFQAKLLERAGNFKTESGVNSITALPIVTAPAGNMTGYIQTNLMSITDGHLFFDSEMFFDGVRPPINQFYSVTRVGKQTQTPLAQQLSNIALKMLHDYAHAQEFSKFGSQIAEVTQQNLKKGKALQKILTQSKDVMVPLPLQLYLVGMIAFYPNQALEVDSLIHRYFNDKQFANAIHLLNQAETIKDYRQGLGKIG